MKIRPIFVWYDLWVGFYWDRRGKILYFFPIPMVGLKITFSNNKHTNTFHTRLPALRVVGRKGIGDGKRY